jgi:malonyl-CoA O-methyltransferase
VPYDPTGRDYEVVPVAEGYDRWSTLYDAMDNPLVVIEEPVVDDLLGPVEGSSLLDLGCGTGRHAVRLAARGADVTAVDFSNGMLAKARAKPGADRVRFVQHDLSQRLPFDDASFEHLICCLVLEHVPDLEPVYREMRRVCRGAAVISLMHPAMMLRGVLAHFDDPVTGREVQPRSVAHETADFIMAALTAGWRLDHIVERAPDAELAGRSASAGRYLGWPLLLALRLR